VRGPLGRGNTNDSSGYSDDEWVTVSDEPAWRAFETEALPHVDRLFRLAMWLERDRAEAEDLVQETLTQALQSFHRFSPGTNCRAWLTTILQHIRSNRRRARNRTPVENAAIEERFAQTLAFVPPVPDHLTDEDVLGALRQIPETYQEVILLCDVQEMTYKEVASALNIPIGTVMSRLHRGRELLRVALSSNSAASIARTREIP
jgi:RNA polymerase sigma-70 factor, ECF subfamily